jgi:hypothetical protein
MDSCVVRRRTRIKNINAQTVNSANGVLLRDVASVSIRGDTIEGHTLNFDHKK